MQRATIAGCVCLLCAVCARAQQPESSATIITFDAPGASRAPYQGTFATSINGAGIIAGYYIDANAVSHGFVRASDGAMTTFDAPEAGTGAGQGTFALSINAAGAIAGYYITAQNVARALIRTIGGTFTTFAAPGAGTTAYRGTFAVAINNGGEVVGYYADTGGNNHGFVLAGTVASFDAPGAGTLSGQGTWGLAINDSGIVTGDFMFPSSTTWAFVRDSSGAVTTFDVVDGQDLTVGASINAAGVIAGYGSGAGDRVISFTRAVDGTITKIYVPGTWAAQPGTGVWVSGINKAGQIAGSYTVFRKVYQSYGHFNGNHVATFAAPGAGTAATQGTFAAAINDAGDIVGYNLVGNEAHGFLRTP